MKRARWVWLAAGVMAAGCSVPVMPLGPTMSAWTTVIGHIDSTGMNMSPLVVPDTVQAGAWFSATIVTFGSRGCFRPGETDLQRAESAVSITPFDSARIGSRRCLPGLMAAPRVVALRFDEPGVAIVRLKGRGFRGMIVMERAIVVR